MKLGLIARPDPCGLGTLSQEFFENLPFLKVLALGDPTLYRHKFPQALWANSITNDLGQEFLKDLDLFITFETPYNWDLFDLAREKGIKSILVPNFEWEPRILPSLPDCFLCPTLADYYEMPEPKLFLPIPVNRKRLPFRRKEKVRTFVHNAGRGGAGNRNSTLEVLQSLFLLKKPVEFIVNLQPVNHFSAQINEILEKLMKEKESLGKRGLKITINTREVGNYENLYSEGDVLVHPQKYGGLSLPIQEAISNGMAVIAINRFPENQFLEKDFLIESSFIEPIFIQREVLKHTISPEQLAKKIDKIFGMEIGIFSNHSDRLAEHWSWERLKSFYLRLFTDVIAGRKIFQTVEQRKNLLLPS